MTFTEKLARLTADKNKSSLAKAAGLPATAISNYISRKYIPRADTALRIAKALNVPLEWLADDAQPWPPPKGSKPSPSFLSDDDLMRETALRFRRDAMRLAEIAEHLERIDWKSAAELLLLTPIEDGIPDGAAEAIEATRGHGVFGFVKDSFSLPRYVERHHSELPGGDRPAFELDVPSILKRAMKITNENRYFAAVMEYVSLRGSHHESGKSYAQQQAEIDLIAKRLDFPTDARKPRRLKQRH
jgi:transcriptional regulator with XRE-family HTH domain